MNRGAEGTYAFHRRFSSRVHASEVLGITWFVHVCGREHSTHGQDQISDPPFMVWIIYEHIVFCLMYGTFVSLITRGGGMFRLGVAPITRNTQDSDISCSRYCNPCEPKKLLPLIFVVLPPAVRRFVSSTSKASACTSCSPCLPKKFLRCLPLTRPWRTREWADRGLQCWS